jgi:hypothetical protein
MKIKVLKNNKKKKVSKYELLENFQIKEEKKKEILIKNENPILKTNFFGKICYSWVGEIIDVYSKKLDTIKQEDLFGVPEKEFCLNFYYKKFKNYLKLTV